MQVSVVARRLRRGGRGREGENARESERERARSVRVEQDEDRGGAIDHQEAKSCVPHAY